MDDTPIWTPNPTTLTTPASAPASAPKVAPSPTPSIAPTPQPTRKPASAPKVAPAVRLEHASKRFGAVAAVDGLTLDIEAGQVVALLGPNGAGKSTTIDMILGFTQPDDGAVEVFGHDPKRAIAQGKIAAVLQSGGLLPDYTVAETVHAMATLFPNARRPAEVIELADLTPIRDRRVGKCSGGEQQRLRFALALLPDPELMILDEPTTGMDVEGRRDFWDTMRNHTEHRRSVLFATHYLDEADAFADRIVVMAHGRLLADGTPSEIKAFASGRTVRATLPNARRDQLLELPGVDAVEQRGDTVLLHGSDSDGVARYLLNHSAARDLEIASRNLEEAFVALTHDRTTTPRSAGYEHEGASA